MTVKKATKKTPAKKAATKKPAEYWAWTFKGDGEMYKVFTSYDKMMADIKEVIAGNHYYSNKPVEVQIFKMEKEMKFQVTVEEVPATTKKITVKEAA